MTKFLNQAEDVLGTLVAVAVPAFITAAMLAFTAGF